MENWNEELGSKEQPQIQRQWQSYLLYKRTEASEFLACVCYYENGIRTGGGSRLKVREAGSQPQGNGSNLWILLENLDPGSEEHPAPPQNAFEQDIYPSGCSCTGLPLGENLNEGE